ncbi:MAG: type I glyceraldehyde-3-phosphate dehydrogenase [Eubacterium sp.]|nr:type I glyceraldehyde-3-phosphate dehydrogenase [Eubacterium sp.]MBR2559266.1 type I glyceraldehyde-3-phosphate dehydrogenase [Bacillota bacterium]MBR3212622.1 type I glyceraldehyde-3-phosphate dehydrogenase [Bacillota bacterium]
MAKKQEKTRIAINGFGRIGRMAFRKLVDDPDLEVVAINDLTSPEMLAYLLKYDSVQKRFDRGVEVADNSIVVDGKAYPIYSESDASNAPWGELGVDIVLECTGFYTSKAKSEAHLRAGARKVLISAPAGNDLPTIVYGVNHETLKKEDKIVSAASCTTNCLAPMAKVLNDYREIRTGFMSTIHAYTGDQMILDGPHKKGDFRRARAGALNIVPNSTGAAAAIGLVIPELDGKLIGSAQRVPVPTGSLTILDATVKDEAESVSVEGINRAMKAAASESFGYNEEPIVSTDIIGSTYGSVFDATQTLAQRCGTKIYEVRVVAWYDNEMGYTCQMIRTLKHMAKL